MKNPKLKALALSFVFLGISLPSHGAVKVPAGANHVISGTVRGSLIAIDPPTLPDLQAFSTVAPGGPVWATGTPTGTIAHAADNGFYIQSSIGANFTSTPAGFLWEPDGTPLSQAQSYGVNLGSRPEISYIFNLASSGIDLPDGSVINAVYTTWRVKKNNVSYSYTEGAASDSIGFNTGTWPAADLAMRWYDSDGNPHDADFQRLFAGPITVVGGDGFTLNQQRVSGFALIDAVFLDVTLPGDGGTPTMLATGPQDDTSGVPLNPTLRATFDVPVALTGNGSVTIYNVDTMSNYEVITLPDSRVRTFGVDLTINLGQGLDLNTTYAVLISNDAVKNLNSADLFGGIGDPETWNFTTKLPPTDLTNGEAPVGFFKDNPSKIRTYNLGPTGAEGWIYYPSDESVSTIESRQIYVTKVDTGSPADGLLLPGDLILGVSGDGAAPAYFTSDARHTFADAITEAEARDPATLKLLRWRAGDTTTVTLTLQTLGSYSATAPYNCPKSALILKQALAHIMSSQGPDRFSMSTLSLLAANDPSDPDNAARMARAEAEALALIPTDEKMAIMNSDVIERGSKVPWGRGPGILVLTGYYDVTRDPRVIPAIRAHISSIANGQSTVGSIGHSYAYPRSDGSPNGSFKDAYGPINSAGMPCWLGLAIAKKAGISHPLLDTALARANSLYGYYAGKGGVPYGEHPAVFSKHETNGKSGLAALGYSFQEGYDPQRNFFSKMAAASGSEREKGHTGSLFNQLWAPLGAAVGGEQAAAAHFRSIRWYLDLGRRWDGGFMYINNGDADGKAPTIAAYETWAEAYHMSTAAVLTYALPLRQLSITGRGHQPAHDLTPAEINDVIFAADYDPALRTTSQLLADLGTWSNKVKNSAAIAIGRRTAEHSWLLPVLTQMTNDPDDGIRAGACMALGEIGDASSAPILAALLRDPENRVRLFAGNAFHKLPSGARRDNLNAVLYAIAATQEPFIPIGSEDPLQHTRTVFNDILFDDPQNWNLNYGIIYNNITGVDRDLLYPAIRAMAKSPSGGGFAGLRQIIPLFSEADFFALADCLVDLVGTAPIGTYPAANGSRRNALDLLQQYNIAEGVPLALNYIREVIPASRDGGIADALGSLSAYGKSVNTVTPFVDSVGLANELIEREIRITEAQAFLDAFAADTNPETLDPFKSISSVVADHPTLTLPAKRTALRVNAGDFAKGESIYTWRKVHGAGEAFIAPNGTADARTSTVLFDGTPGEYLFEVTMSDSRGLTEVSATVAVTLNPSSGSLPPNSPPTATPGSLTVAKGFPLPVTLHGSDPEGYPLTYRIISGPLHGKLTGTPPALVYAPGPSHMGADGFTFEVMDSEGQTSSAAINLNIEGTSNLGLAIYEPFDYPVGSIDGQSGTSEIGLTGTWNSNTDSVIALGSLSYGYLPTTGGKIVTPPAKGNVASRSIDPAALAGNGLLADGSTLWFSFLAGYPQGDPATDHQLALALASQSFAGGGFSIVDEGSQKGSGLGFLMIRYGKHDPQFLATEFDDGAYNAGEWDVDAISLRAGTYGFYIGKITWGVTPDDVDYLEIYKVNPDLTLPDKPVSTRSLKVDQSTFDTLTWRRLGAVVMDEIRFGPTYYSVLAGTTAMTEDLTPPNAVTFHLPPTPASATSITMTASHVVDPVGVDPYAVEYHFTAVSGGGNDSGWQSSPTYTDTGLTPGMTYGYTVTARDRSPAANQTSPSATAHATLVTTTSIPDVTNMNQADAESLLKHADLTVGNISYVRDNSVAPGTVLSQSPESAPVVNVGTAVDLVVSSPTYGDTAAFYEPFDYPAGGLHNRNGGTGFTAPWLSTKGDPLVANPGKTWAELDVYGGHLRGNSWTAAVRPIGSSLQDSGLLADGATLWFSTILDLSGQDNTTANINLALGSDQFVSDSLLDRGNLRTGQGIGISHHRGTIQGVYWNNNDADPVSERSYFNSTKSIDPNAIGGSTRVLIIGRINWGVGASAAETLTLYAPTSQLTLGKPIINSWAIPPMDQSQFTKLAIQLNDQAQIDEIRFGESPEGAVELAKDTRFKLWTGFWGVSGSNALLNSDPDGDGIVNLLEFGFGMNPGMSDPRSLLPDGSRLGVPIIQPAASDMEYQFVRRKDHSTPSSLRYTVEFSSDLGNFYDSPTIPTFVSDTPANPEYELVKVPFPQTLPDGKPARFARLKVLESP